MTTIQPVLRYYRTFSSQFKSPVKKFVYKQATGSALRIAKLANFTMPSAIGNTEIKRKNNCIIIV